jgi:hypothetical protein
MVEATRSNLVRESSTDDGQFSGGVRVRYLPCSQHLNKMLLSCSGLLALSQARKDTVLLKKSLTGRSLDLDHVGMRNVNLLEAQ